MIGRFLRAAPQTVAARVSRAGDVTTVTVGTRRFHIRGAQAGTRPTAGEDAALYGLAALSMTHNLRIRLHAPVSAPAIAGLRRMSAIYEDWLGVDVYPLALTAEEEVVPDPASAGGGILCLSGGVDSTYAGILARDSGLTHAVLIDGFEHASKHAGGFSVLRERVDGIARLLGLRLTTLETDIRLLRPSLALFHGYILAMALRHAGHGLAFGAIAADYTLAQSFERHPWGNSPVVAEHLSAGDFPVAYLGSETSRTEKIGAIARELPEALPRLTVCNDDHFDGRNCGRCLKCSLTAIAAVAAGLDNDAIAFVGTPDPVAYLRTIPGTSLSPSKLRITYVRLAELCRALPDGALREVTRAAAGRLRRRIHVLTGFRRRLLRRPYADFER